MSFAADTKIAIPGGAAPIGDLGVGDQVLAADAGLQWQPHVLRFSDGVLSPQPGCIFLTFATGATLVVTGEQPFLMAGGVVKKAQQLRHGEMVVGSDGGAVRIEEFAVGEFGDGVWDVATSMEQDAPHFLIANGIVAGDYEMQVFSETDPPATRR